MGADVTIVDNLSTGFERNVPAGARLLRVDVTDRAAMADVFASHRFDTVLHLAAQTSNILSHEDPWLDFQTNVGGTINMLAGVMRHRIGRVLYASSMALYGAPEATPVSEACALRPLSPYGISKLAAEQLIHTTSRRRDLAFPLSVTSLRMFNVYGPGQSLENLYQGVISVFIANLLAKQPITLFGDGLQTRDFVYIDDVLAAWMAAIRTPGLGDTQINIGSGREHSINDLLNAVLGAFGHDRASYPIVQKPELPGDQRTIRADITRAQDRLSWSPRVGLDEGLKATIEWGRTHWNVDSS